MKKYINLFIKGMGMGAANVIPGVSGGTVALITGIFEELIDSIKSFNLEALKLIFKGKIKEFIKYTNLWFLIAVFGGAIVSVLSLAKALEFLFENNKTFVYAFFFGLILASVYYVGKTVGKWNLATIISFVVGTSIAVAISVLNPANENSGLVYLLICGVVAICSMILPGLSGSFVLLLMGNYELVMIEAVSDLNLEIIIPVGIGAVIGLIAFSNLLSWIFKKYKDQTISLLTGFILGSLMILWPWKNEIYAARESGEILLKDGEQIIEGFSWYLPSSLNSDVIISILLILAGIVSIALMEKVANKKEKA